MMENMKREKADNGGGSCDGGGGRVKLEWNWSGEGGRKSGGKSKRWLNRETSEGDGTGATCREVGCSKAGLAFQADLVNRVHYFLVISFYNSSLLS